MASSIRAGVKAVQAEAPTAEGVLLMTCDQPRVSAEHLARADPDVLCAIGADGNCIRPTPEFAASRQFSADRLFMICSLFAAIRERVHCWHTPPWPVISIPLDGGEIDIDLPEDLALPG